VGHHNTVAMTHESDARTHRTLKALRAKFLQSVLCFAKLWSAHASPRSFSAVSQYYLNVKIVMALLVLASLSLGCSRKQAQVAPNAPEVLVTTVTPQDVPRVLERVATLDGFINANINAQVQGYIVSRDYQEGSVVVKKGDLLF